MYGCAYCHKIRRVVLAWVSQAACSYGWVQPELCVLNPPGNKRCLMRIVLPHWRRVMRERDLRRPIRRLGEGWSQTGSRSCLICQVAPLCHDWSAVFWLAYVCRKYTFSPISTLPPLLLCAGLKEGGAAKIACLVELPGAEPTVLAHLARLFNRTRDSSSE